MKIVAKAMHTRHECGLWWNDCFDKYEEKTLQLNQMN